MSFKVSQRVLSSFIYVLSQNYVFEEAQEMTNYYPDTTVLTFLHKFHLFGCLVLAVKHLYLRTKVKLRCDKSFL